MAGVVPQVPNPKTHLPAPVGGGAGGEGANEGEVEGEIEFSAAFVRLIKYEDSNSTNDDETSIASNLYNL